MKQWNTAGAVLASVFTVSCGGDTPHDTVSCPDVIEYADPLVAVTSVVDSSRDESLIQVTLSELQIDGQDVQFDELASEQMSNVDIASDGLSATCTIPCGLFTTEAAYSVVFSAPAFEPKRVTFAPTYDTLDTTSCPTTYSGSYELSVELDPVTD